MKKVPNSGPEAPPTFMTSVMPIAFSISGNDLSARPGSVGEHGLETALHVQSVIAVADRLVEAGQFFGMLDHRTLRAPAPVFPWLPDRDSCRDPPAIRIEEQRLVEAKRHDIPGAEPGFRVGQRHDGLAAKVEMEMVLVAEMLDPRRRSLVRRRPPRAIVRCSVRAPIVLAPARRAGIRQQPPAAG